MEVISPWTVDANFFNLSSFSMRAWLLISLTTGAGY